MAGRKFLPKIGIAVGVLIVVALGTELAFPGVLDVLFPGVPRVIRARTLLGGFLLVGVTCGYLALRTPRGQSQHPQKRKDD